MIAANENTLTFFRNKANGDYTDKVFSAPIDKLTNVVVKNSFLGMQKKVKFYVGSMEKSIVISSSSKELIAFFQDLAKTR